MRDLHIYVHLLPKLGHSSELEMSIIFFSLSMERSTSKPTYVGIWLASDFFLCVFTVDKMEPTVQLDSGSFNQPFN